MIYKGTTSLKAFKGNHKPVNIYKGNIKVAGWQNQNKTGKNLIFYGTYDDVADVTISAGNCNLISRKPNVLPNGNFANGTTGWGLGSATTMSVLDNVLYMTGTSSNNGTVPNVSTNVGVIQRTFLTGQKVYLSAYLKIPSEATLTYLALRDIAGGLSIRAASSPGSTNGNFVRFSGVVTLTSESLAPKFQVATQYANSPSLGKVVEIKECMMIDMGKDSSHPLYNKTSAEMDALFAKWDDKQSNVYAIPSIPIPLQIATYYPNTVIETDVEVKPDLTATVKITT